MKLSLIGPVYPYRGGIAHYTTFLSKALKSNGHGLQLISFKRQYPAFLYPGESDKDPSANPIRLDAHYLLDPLYPWTWQKTARTILSYDPDLVLVQWWTTFWGPAYAGLTYRLRDTFSIAYLVHNVLPHEAKPWDRWFARLALSNGNAFIVQTPNEQERLLALFPGARVCYCKHPVYQRFSERAISQEEARKELGLSVDLPLLLFFGIIRPYKGLKIMLDALSYMDTPIHLVVAGEFWDDVEIYLQQIKGLGLDGKVTVINRYIPNEDAHLLFSAANVFVAPYLGGTQSGAVELALGYGLPTIVTEQLAAGITEDNIARVKIIPAGDVIALSNAINDVVAELPDRTALKPAPDDWGRLVKTIETLSNDL